jgi:hypothetical protein
MLPFIGRPLRTKTRSQSSEHGVVATSKHHHPSRGCCVERHVWFLRDPDAVEQDGQLTSYRNYGLALGLLPTSRGQMQAHCRSEESFPCGRRMWLAHSISRLRRYALPALVMPS